MEIFCVLFLITNGFVTLSLALPFSNIQPPFTMPKDDWNITSLPRSVVPVLKARGQLHFLPSTVTQLNENDETVFDGLQEYNTPRMLMSDSLNTTHNATTTTLQKIIKILNYEKVHNDTDTTGILVSKVTCTGCKAIYGLLQHFIKAGTSTEKMINAISNLCVTLKLLPPIACAEGAQLYLTDIVHVLRLVTIGPEEICSLVLNDACGGVYTLHQEWEVTLPPVPKPDPENVLPLPQEGVPIFKVLHLADTHYDPHYVEGSNAACNEPLCCRLSNGQPAALNDAAGKWGDYRFCDTPKRTIDHMLDHISHTHPDIDYILWTGDAPPHNIWNSSKTENLDIIRETLSQMSEKFPNIPIFPALGNHESTPQGSVPQPFIQQEEDSIAWLYDELNIQWRKWLPASASPTIHRGAFYSVLLRPGFRIISINTNYGSDQNYWLLVNSTDPASELQWLAYELQLAEFANEKVHIIGHLPPGFRWCLKVWSQNYHKIISRYESTVTGQFFGHTHFDEFEVFYDPIHLERATSIAYVAPSVTPYTKLNPGYRIYYVDGDHDSTTRMVIDHENWIFDLEEANLSDNPIWFKLYSAREAYEMEGLRPSDWDKLIHTMTINQETFDLYYKHQWKNSRLRSPCDMECRKEKLCDCKSGRSHDRQHLCEGIVIKPDADHNIGSPESQKNTAFDSIGTPSSTDDNTDYPGSEHTVFDDIGTFSSADDIAPEGITNGDGIGMASENILPVPETDSDDVDLI